MNWREVFDKLLVGNGYVGVSAMNAILFAEELVAAYPEVRQAGQDAVLAPLPYYFSDVFLRQSVYSSSVITNAGHIRGSSY